MCRAWGLRLFLLWLAFLLAAPPVFAGLSLTGTVAGQSIVLEFGDEELAELLPLLKLSTEPTPAQAARAFSRLPAATREKIAALRNAEVNGAFSADIPAFAAVQGLSFADIDAIRKTFLDTMVAETIAYLEANPTAIVRFIARDMNEVFHHFLAAVQADRSRTLAQRLDLLRRAKAATLSRPVAAATLDAPMLWATLAVSPEEAAAASEVLLLDLGYDGSLARRTRQLVGETGDGEKLRWRFAWKSPNAPAEVTAFALTEFNRFIQQHYPQLAEGGALHRIGDGFRVRIFEHGPKWNQRSDGYVPAPVYVMLDVDDTVLKEVDHAKYGLDPRVQSVSYRPSPGDFQRYAERMRGGAGDGKILHYEITGKDEIRSYVLVRPAMVSLLRDLKPMMDRGEINVLVTSANDEKRTQAVFEQIVVGDRTLAQWGAAMISPSKFGISGGRKSVAKLREDHQLGTVAPIVAIDDLGHKVVDYLPQDNSVSIEPWNEKRSTDFLAGNADADSFAVEDETAFAGLAQLIRNKRFVRKPSHWEHRLRVLAGLMAPAAEPTAVQLPPAPARPRVSEPSLWDVTPQVVPGLAPRWPEWRRGTLEAAAYARVFFRGEDLYATGRDSLIPLYAMMLASKDDPDFLNRLHYLDVSTISFDSPLLESFLAQEGISRESLAAGQKVRFIDIGYSGSTPAKIRALFKNEFDPQLQHYFMAANPDYQTENPYSLMWNIAVNPKAVAENGRHYVTEIQEVELQIPKVHKRTNGYVQDAATGKVTATRTTDPADFLEGTLSVEEHKKYMADFTAWTETPEVKQLLAERHEMWTVLKRLADERRDAELVGELQKIARNAAHDPFAEGIVYEMASYALAPIRIAGTGPTLTVTLEPEGCAQVLMKHPPRRR